MKNKIKVTIPWARVKDLILKRTKYILNLTLIFKPSKINPPITRLSQTEFTCVQDGKFAYNSCTQYYQCVYTNTLSAYKVLYTCPTDTLFDESVQQCIWTYQYNCSSDNLEATTVETTTKS